MDDIKTFLEGLAVPFILSIFGGLARSFRDGVTSWRKLVGELFISAFAGVMVHLLVQDVDLSANTRAAMYGISGYSGAMILDALANGARRGVERITQWDGQERRNCDGCAGQDRDEDGR